MTRIVHGWIVNLQSGMMVITRRSLDKKIYPGLWDSCSGHVEEGEKDMDAMVRELHEELGITAKKLIHVGEFNYPSVKYSVNSYIIPIDRLDELSIQQEEIMDHKIVSYDDNITDFIPIGTEMTMKMRRTVRQLMYYSNY